VGKEGGNRMEEKSILMCANSSKILRSDPKIIQRFQFSLEYSFWIY